VVKTTARTTIGGSNSSYSTYEKVMRKLSVCLSVRLSVRQMRELWQNGRKICPDFYTIRWSVWVLMIPPIFGCTGTQNTRTSHLGMAVSYPIFTCYQKRNQCKTITGWSLLPPVFLPEFSPRTRQLLSAMFHM